MKATMLSGCWRPSGWPQRSETLADQYHQSRCQLWLPLNYILCHLASLGLYLRDLADTSAQESEGQVSMLRFGLLS